MPRLAQADVREKIIQAAKDRLWHYGFKKTTIEEIASDAGVGKGTVYLYFAGKEDIALAIMAQFKSESLKQLEIIAYAPQMSTLQKLKAMLTGPILQAHERCLLSPGAQEMISAVRPYIQAKLQPFREQEIALIAEVLEEGSRIGTIAIRDKAQAARTLKLMCAGFWPPYPCVEGLNAVQSEVARIVEMAYYGLGRKEWES